MRIAICDDDKQFVSVVKEHLNFYENEKHIKFDIKEFTSSEELLNYDEKINIAILDVEMPNCNGIELGKRLQDKNKHMVLMYITSYKKYLDEALNLNAARFFEKPLDSGRFYSGLDNALERIDNTNIQLFLKDNKNVIRIDSEDIIYIEIDSKNHRDTRIVTENGVYVSPEKISYWDEQLVSNIFARTHKSFIVNLNYVTKYNRNCLELNNEYTVPISRANQSLMHKIFVRFLAGF